jgi:ubiquinone/menaquinone biosynthesis C-methylase UbiE
VLDLAAGTGKLTRALVPSGADVIAVEPVDGMRQALAASVRPAVSGGPPTSVVAAVAQALPVGDGTLDAITVGQAFHWFATGDVLAEMHRALGRDGRLCLVWNRRDQSDPLQAALTSLMEPWRGETPSHESGEWRRVLENSDRFEARGETHVAWRQVVDVEAVADRVASVSFIAAMADDDRRRLLDQVRAVASEVPPPLALVYRADAFCFTRIG